MTQPTSEVRRSFYGIFLTVIACGRVRSGGSQDASSDVPTYQDGAATCMPCPEAGSADTSSPDGGPTFDSSADAPWSLNLYTDAASDGFVALAPDAGGAFGSLVVLDERHVYWTGGPARDGIGLSGVSSVSKAGGPVTQWYDGSAGSEVLSVTVTSAAVYILGPDWIVSVPLSNPNATVVHLNTDLNTWSPTAFSASPSGAIYAVENAWPYPTSESVLALNISGAAPTVLVSRTPVDGLGYTGGSVLVDDENIFWIPSDQEAIYRTPLAGGTTDTLASFTGPTQQCAFAMDDASLYWLNGSNLISMPKNGGATVTLATVGMGGFSGSSCLALDDTSVYFSQLPDVGFSVYTGYIASVPKAGGTVVTLVQSGSPQGIAVDDVALYWVDEQSNSLLRMRKGGGP